MFASLHNHTAAYQQVAVESRVAEADPHRLILLLFEAAEMAIASAKHQMTDKCVTDRSDNISRAIDIILNGLKASLNTEEGGEIAENLAALYDYMVARLMRANIANDPAPLDEVNQLLGEIHSAWKQILPQAGLSAPPPPAP